jgi:hypothetical protein
MSEGDGAQLLAGSDDGCAARGTRAGLPGGADVTGAIADTRGGSGAADRATATRRPGMRFAVEAWDPSYGSSVDLDGELGYSTAVVDPDVEVPAERWRALPPVTDLTPPSAVLFVDGVRRIDARVWIEQPSGPGTGVGAGASGICASYAAGVVVCNGHAARLAAAEVSRGLFTTTVDGDAVATSAGDYPLRLSRSDEGTDLSLALQGSLGQAEVSAAVAARAALPTALLAVDEDLLVIDGPLRGRAHLPRTIGYIKSHRAGYLPPALNAVVGTLGAGQRTPLFHMGTSWDRYSWYLRLPCQPNGAWAGVVRVECSPDLSPADAARLANLSQAILPRYASAEHKDRRAPQNLYPIAGLERQLRRRLGDPGLLYRALRRAAASTP